MYSHLSLIPLAWSCVEFYEKCFQCHVFFKQFLMFCFVLNQGKWNVQLIISDATILAVFSNPGFVMEQMIAEIIQMKITGMLVVGDLSQCCIHKNGMCYRQRVHTREFIQQVYLRNREYTESLKKNLECMWHLRSYTFYLIFSFSSFSHS